MEFSNISTEGKLAMKENQITVEDIYTFTEGDIKDLFKSFNDRRIVRKLINLKHVHEAGNMDKNMHVDAESETTNSCTTTDLETSESETEKSSTSSSSTTSVSSILTPITKFNVDEMLRKKAIRTKSNSAQTYFNSLMKDAMKATKLWKNPLTLQDITSRKKEEFHTIIESHVPALKSKRSEIWRRVGEHLQNRRKYLKDKSTGKRQKFLARKVDTSEKRKKGDSGLCNLKPGDLVKLKHSCDGTNDIVDVGTGIFLGEEDDMYSNVVLKSKDMEAEVDVDLPAVSPDGATTIKTAGVKQMILFKTKKLEKLIVNKKTATPRNSSTSNANRELKLDDDELHIVDVDSNDDEDISKIEKKKRLHDKQTVSSNESKAKCSKREIQSHEKPTMSSNESTAKSSKGGFSFFLMKSQLCLAMNLQLNVQKEGFSFSPLF